MPSHTDNADHDSLNDPSTLKDAWLKAGGTLADFLFRKPQSLDAYESDKLEAAGIEIEKCTLFLERAKGVLGTLAFSALCGEEAQRKHSKGEKPKTNATARFIGLVVYRVGINAEEWASAKKTTDKVLPPASKKAAPMPNTPSETLPQIPVSGKNKKKSAEHISTTPPQNRDALIFSSTMMIVASFPHHNPGSERAWVRTNGDRQLILQAGVNVKPNGEKVEVGLPYGVFPRLIMHYIADQVFRYKSPRISLGSSMYKFLETLGLSDSTRNFNELREQITRLAFSNYRVVTHTSWFRKNGQIATGSDVTNAPPLIRHAHFWWTEKKEQEELDLFENHLILGDEYFNDLLTTCMPLDLDALRALRKSTFQLDLYHWLTYKAFKINNEPFKTVLIPYATLSNQFAQEFNREANFRLKLKKVLEEITTIWRGELNYELSRDGLILKPSTVQIESKSAPKLLPPSAKHDTDA